MTCVGSQRHRKKKKKEKENVMTYKCIIPAILSCKGTVMDKMQSKNRENISCVLLRICHLTFAEFVTQWDVFY